MSCAGQTRPPCSLSQLQLLFNYATHVSAALPLLTHQRLNGPVSSLGDNDAALAAAMPSSLGVSSTPAEPAASATDAALRERKTRNRKKNFFETTSQDELEPVRVPRPAGVPEWGVGGGGPEAPVKGARAEDRWV